MTTAGSEITAKTATGSTKFDLGMKDAGKNVGVEVKTGPTAKLNSNQKAQHGEINAGGANTMTGGNATNAGLAGQSVDYAVTVHVENGEVTRMYCAIKPGGGC